MRLKFRAWATTRNDGTREMLTWDTQRHAIAEWIGNEERGVTIMQFTGLLDRHGKEIYEGDIYRTPNETTGSIMDLVVRFNHGSFGLVRHGSYAMNPKNLGSKVNREMGHVIGNIHETPALVAPANKKGE